MDPLKRSLAGDDETEATPPRKTSTRKSTARKPAAKAPAKHRAAR